MVFISGLNFILSPVPLSVVFISGLYKVFFKAHPNQATVLTKLEKACAGAEERASVQVTSCSAERVQATSTQGLL